MLVLNEDILREVFSHLRGDNGSLSSTCAVSRVLRKVATPVLYSHVRIKEKNALASFLHTLTKVNRRDQICNRQRFSSACGVCRIDASFGCVCPPLSA